MKPQTIHIISLTSVKRFNPIKHNGFFPSLCSIYEKSSCSVVFPFKQMYTIIQNVQ
jgi:hypothetical protein